MGYIKSQKIPIIRTLVSIVLILMMVMDIYAMHRAKYVFNDIIPKYKTFMKYDVHYVKMLPIIIGPMEDIFNIVFLTMVNIMDKILPISSTNVLCAHAPISLSLPLNNNSIVIFVHLAKNTKIAPYGFKSKFVKMIIQFIYMNRVSKNKIVLVMPSGVVLEIKGNFKVVKSGSFGVYICGNNVEVIGMRPLSIARGTVNWLCLIKEKHLLY